MDQNKKEQIAEVSANLAEWQRKSALIAAVLLFAGIVSMGVMLIPSSEDSYDFGTVNTTMNENTGHGATTASSNDNHI